jgi:hypothetical protein
MKTILKNSLPVVFASLLITTVLTSCGGKKNESIVAPEGMLALDLNRYGKPFAIFIPDTNHTKLQVTEEPSGALHIRVGNSFAVAISEQPSDLELKKRDIKEDEVNRFKSFIKEESQGILWESEITQPEYHFLINGKIGTSEYSFEDLRDEEGNTLPRASVEKMYESCRNIKESAHKNDA